MFALFLIYPANARWTALVHERKRMRLVRTVYAIVVAALLIQHTDAASAADVRPLKG